MPKRPYVICHMTPSIDGKIVATNWPSMKIASAAYECAASHPEAADVAKGFHREAKTRSYAIAIDPSGKLTWRSNAIDDAHVITVLTERVSDDYLAFLESRGVSYVFGGRASIDLRRVLAKLRTAFGIRRLLLEGGGTINGSFLAAGLIDELSILIAPVADGSVGTPTLFDAMTGKGLGRKLRLISISRIKGDLVWLRYKM